MFDIHRVELDWGGRKLVLETGKIARQADGAVMVSYGDTVVLVHGQLKPELKDAAMERFVRGKTAYEEYCVSCHGPSLTDGAVCWAWSR